ncbi:unnamed protein product [Aspergillus oryzae]|uniref:Unnamed protein product n=2 Tax=Aspergillus oryzae TaxID=5062 RepID=A0AAN5BSP4_ASPOZ|nr:unnamed protein product [Aspergillus oryzae]GMF85890.1 unnamed protein product [Aspergillus oryzae]GMG01172.1 unnamed protein product [Aspergillus oryzae]GMG22857.1 unnamed protein product [Aspergillus oryzae]GMG44894.1 unnamed protein product [Aspergillus oryzae var. brunneus]
MKHTIYRCTACSRQRLPFPLRRALSTAITPNTPSNPNKVPLHDLTPADISYYWDTQVPNETDLTYADKFFAPSRHSPIKIWSASKFRTTPMSSVEPEVAFLGRSNVGKSSLLNAIMGKEICWTSSKPGRTREMNAFGIGGTKGGESKIVLLDMPGYGKASRTEWGIEIMNLHGLKKTDEDILMLFRKYAIPHQVIMSKVDKILAKKKSQVKSGASAAKVATLQTLLQSYRPILQPDGRLEGPGALGEILTCSAETPISPGKSLGISAIRWAILSAAGFDGNMKAHPVPTGSQVTNISPAAS